MGGRGATSSGGGGLPNDATEYYVSGEGMWINQYLRGNGDFGELSDSEKEYLRDLDRATNGKITDSELYRSVDASAIFGNISSQDAENLVQYLQYGGESFGKGAYADSIRNRMQSIIDRTQGKTQTEKGFMSTTADRRVAEDFGGFTGSENPVVMRIKTSPNTKGVNLSAYDRNVADDQAQKERLLARGQSYEVGKIYAENGNIYVDVKMK